MTLELSKNDARVLFDFIYKALALFWSQVKLVQFRNLEFCNETALQNALHFLITPLLCIDLRFEKGNLLIAFSWPVRHDP
jgi:hypothetical protein